ncbi:hypothetical protein E4U43_004819 [Claviceps pusilla]|uniref:Uncharacterized protein n=1 Tax=Claviceps pusilla TaxID=123648 RepID=A0A9P7N3M2_9HYPO|nr:hypothetical protein E4U43_004819 [Claviceps pusilla]
MPQSKADKIADVQAKLPLPEQPPAPSDWQSADARNVNVGSGRVEGHVGTDKAAESGLREPASKGDVDLSDVGRTDRK